MRKVSWFFSGMKNFRKGRSKVMANLDKTRAYNEDITEILESDDVLASFVNNYLSQLLSNMKRVKDGYLPLAGGTMTGPLVLAVDPEEDMEAATKKYADINRWKANGIYEVGDICYSKNAASYKRMECVVAGIAGVTEPTWKDVGTLVTDGAVTWIVDDVRDGAMPGDVIQTYVAAPRPGTMIADGSAVSRTVYSRLFAAIGTTYGAGDGATTFNLPDHRNRMTLAIGASFPTIGAKGGEVSHVLTESEGPIHGHDINDPGHTHRFEIWHSSPGDFGKVSTTYTLNYYGVYTVPASTTGITVKNSSGGVAHNNMTPYITALFCIKY